MEESESDVIESACRSTEDDSDAAVRPVSESIIEPNPRSNIAAQEDECERALLDQLDRLRVFRTPSSGGNENANEIEFDILAELDNVEESSGKMMGYDIHAIPVDDVEVNPLNLEEEHINPVLYWYLRVASEARKFVHSAFFSRFLLLCIIGAGVIAGLRTYPHMEKLLILTYIEFAINSAFVMEVVVKLCAEGRRPYMYFTGPERKWNIFDFSIVLFSTAPFLSIGNVRFLRLIRLMRLAYFFRSIKQLQMIMEGLVGGLQSTFNLVFLMMLLVFMFAEMGIFFFRSNDPWHFYNIDTAMITMLRVAAFDNWGEVLYINYYGCDVYPSIYYTDSAEESAPVGVGRGDIMQCHAPEARPILSTVFFVTFCVLVPFCIFSLFIGTITVSMWDSLNRLKLAELMSPATGLDIEEINKLKHKLFNPAQMDRKAREHHKNIRLAFSGGIMTVKKMPPLGDHNPLLYYNILSLKCAKIVEEPWFSNLVMISVVLAAANVTLRVDPNTRYLGITYVIDFCVQLVFVAEFLLKIIAEGKYPLMYFANKWNTFDFCMIVVYYFPGFFEIIRIFRLFRNVVLSRPKLQIIVSALLSGLNSIGFIGLILALYFYVFGLMGTIFFGLNDRVGYGTLHRSILTVFQAVTLDSWSDYLYNNLYGCEVYVGYEGSCRKSHAAWGLTSLFFIGLLILGQLVLLSLFIGVISMRMDEANEEYHNRMVVEEKVKAIERGGKLDAPVDFYYNVFKKIDYSHRKLVGKAEVQLGMNIAGIELSKAEFEFVWDRIDMNHSGSLDFSEFLEFMIDLRLRKKEKLEAVRVAPIDDNHKRPRKHKRNSKLLLSYFNYSQNKLVISRPNTRPNSASVSVSNERNTPMKTATDQEIAYINSPFQSRLGASDVMESVKCRVNVRRKRKDYDDFARRMRFRGLSLGISRFKKFDPLKHKIKPFNPRINTVNMLATPITTVVAPNVREFTPVKTPPRSKKYAVADGDGSNAYASGVSDQSPEPESVVAAVVDDSDHDYT